MLMGKTAHMKYNPRSHFASPVVGWMMAQCNDWVVKQPNEQLDILDTHLKL